MPLENIYIVEGIILVALRIHLCGISLSKGGHHVGFQTLFNLQTCTLCVLQYLTLFTHLIHLLCLPVADCFPLAFLFFVTSFPSYLFPHFHNHGNIVRLNRLNYFNFFVTSDALFCYNVFFS